MMSGVKSCRLYLLLSWIISNYYVISVICKENTLDVPEYDLPDELSFCPLLKVRVLANSKRHGGLKKRRKLKLNRFETFIILNVIIFIQIVRSVTAIIKSSLLRAGDVELNPGPTPPTTPTIEQSTDANVHGPSQATISPALSVERKLNAPAETLPIVAVPSGDVQNFPPEKGETLNDSVLSGAELSTFSYQEEVKQKHDKSLMVGQGITKADAKLDTEIERVDKSDEGYDTPYVQKAKYSASRLSLPPVQSSNVYVFEAGLRQQSRLLVQQQQERVSELRDELLNFEQMDQLAASKRFLLFLTGANKLYRSGERCPVCAICLKDKSKSGGQRKSHVIPKTILHHYWKIHGIVREQADYILDFSRNERLSAGSLTYQLLCGNCEIHYSKMEQQLLSLYLNMAANPNVDLIVTHKDMEDTSWLKYILANIVFRGILANIDLDECFKEQVIVDEIFSLWKFCRSEPKNAVLLGNTLNLKIYLLPNTPFNESLNDFMYPFELLLRMPRCTELVKQQEGTFLYTKFDIFQIVLPLCETSQVYFETFSDGVVVKDTSLYLRWAVHPKVEIHREGKKLRFKYPAKSANLRDHFPAALLRWCASLYELTISRIHNHPRHSKSFLACIDRYTGAEYVGFDTKERMQLAEVLRHDIIDERASRTRTYEELSRENLDKYVSAASKHSPLRQRLSEELLIKELEDKEKLVKHLEAMEKLKEIELKNKEVELEQATRALAQAKKELGETRKELGVARKDLEEAEMKSTYLNEGIESYRLKLLSSRAELQSSREVNFTLNLRCRELEGIEGFQYETHEAKLHRLKFLYSSSLRHSLTQEEHTDLDLLKQLIHDMAADLEFLIEVMQGRDIQQSYEKLHKECKRLLILSPPTTPTDHNIKSPFTSPEQ